MEKEAEACVSLGMDAEFTQRTELPFDVDGAVKLKSQACFDPIEFISGILENMPENVKIYEKSNVITVEKGIIHVVVSSENAEEVKDNDKLIYRPSVMFIYSPCLLANQYLINSKTNLENENIVRGHIYPNEWEIVYEDKIKDGTEYVGVLIIGDKFDPVWVGNRIELSYLYRKGFIDCNNGQYTPQPILELDFS